MFAFFFLCWRKISYILNAVKVANKGTWNFYEGVGSVAPIRLPCYSSFTRIWFVFINPVSYVNIILISSYDCKFLYAKRNWHDGCSYTSTYKLPFKIKVGKLLVIWHEVCFPALQISLQIY